MTKPNSKNPEYTVAFEKINLEDQNLINAAIKVLKANFHPKKHQIGCAVLADSGKIYTAVNIQSSIYGPCAEVIAIGSAIAHGEKNIVSIVAVKKIDDEYPVISPCGGCRQLILDYAHNSTVILNIERRILKTRATSLLPEPYENSFTAIARSPSSDLSG